MARAGAWLALLLLLPLALGASTPALAHAIGGSDAAFVAATRGPAPFPFAYLGAKHMVSGYDHLLFLLGVVFFLRRARDIALYVTLFSAGHSITLLIGVLLGFGLDARLVDAAIGLSVMYKGFDNVGGFAALWNRRPDPRFVVFGFGLVHGLGLAASIEALRPHRDGLLWNLLSFNLGVEIGQILALAVILALLLAWRRTALFGRTAIAVNWLLMTAGVVLTAHQLGRYFIEGA
jgi:hypothetical protein